MARLPDYSIIFLKPTLAEVYDALDDTPIANIFNRRFITLSPNEFYTQISNYESGINLGMDYKVELVDCCERVLLDITSRTTISQFNHSVTGKYQMVYEIVSIGQSFNVPVHLKFTQTTNPSNVFYSNPFFVSNDIKDTVRLDYRGFGVAFGIDYGTPNIICSVRVKGYFTKHEPKTVVDSYLQTGGDMLTLYPTPSIPKNFQIEYQDNHGLKAFEYIRYLTNAVVYIAQGERTYGLRAGKIETASEGVFGSSNFFKASYLAYLSDTDDYTPEYQITPDFALIEKYPFGVYRSDDVPVILAGAFNYPITLGTGFLTILDGDGNVIVDYTEADISVIGNEFLIDISALGLANGDYYINFTGGLFISPLGQTYSILEDSDENNEWGFTIADGDYDNNDYNSDDYFTN